MSIAGASYLGYHQFETEQWDIRGGIGVQNCTDLGYGVLKRLSSVCESAHSDDDDEVLQYATVVPFPGGKAA